MRKSPILSDKLLYYEKVSSNKTEALFLTLMILFFILFIWRMQAVRLDGLAGVFLGFFGMFLFYAVNFRNLVIQITPQALSLVFGIFIWTVPLDNIAGCRIDEIPPLMRNGGAGIHFMFIRKRYRISFNFFRIPPGRDFFQAESRARAGYFLYDPPAW
jgi:hypothetical protein